MAPKLSKTMKHLKQDFESLHLLIQWNMQEKPKSMLDLHEQIERKVYSLNQVAKRIYLDKHGLNAERKATKKRLSIVLLGINHSLHAIQQSETTNVYSMYTIRSC